MKNIFELFSLHCKNALKNAYLFALKSKSENIEPEHLLLGIAREKGSIGSEILTQADMTHETIEKLIKNGSESKKNIRPELSPISQKAIERASLISSVNEHTYIGTEHMLLGILELEDRGVNAIFQSKRIPQREIKNKIRMVFKSTSRFPKISNSLNPFPLRSDEGEFGKYDLATPKKSLLEFFSTHLTDKKIQKNIDPVIGREEEIERIVQILCRRTKNNPLLLGDPGVGKTAIVEGLAKLILNETVPPALLNKKIYTLDLGLLIAGSSFRGEFESRLKNIIREVKADPDIILFIDEVHNIIGAGSAAGSLDAANILKPSLARGEIRCIGATTLEEYKKHIESDAAFERRFQIVAVHEPNPEKTLEILRGVRQYFEKFHRVTISDDALTASVQLAHRYIHDRYFPDKAIDLIDEAASRVKVKMKEDEIVTALRQAEKEFSSVLEEKRAAVLHEDYDYALNLRQKEEAVLDRVARLKKLLHANKHKTLGKITEKDIQELVARVTNIPVRELGANQKKELLNIEKELEKHIIGQETAIQAVAEYMRRSWVGMNDPERPLGSFIFLGPSGVGKTELAKTLAQVVFHDPKALVRIDMSEFSESFQISKLIGSPAGYIGYKDSTSLTDKVKKRPHSVILFDEIEKGHPLVHNLLLQILEDGHLTDATGKMVNFKNTIIIMTSNIGSEIFNRRAHIGFEDTASEKNTHASESFQEAKKQVLDQLSKFFRIEFLNRIDKVIVFSPLTAAALETIVEIQLEKLLRKLAEKNITLRYDKNLLRHIAKISFAPNVGARSIRKNILDLIENPIARKILSAENTGENAAITVQIKNKKIII